MSQRGRELRLFVAVYPPPEVATALQAHRRALLDRGVREVPPGQVHLTLQFIGPTLPGELDRVAESVRASCAGIGPFALRPLRLRTLPARGVPRLIAAETDAPPAVLEVHRRLAHRLARSPRRDSADRFLPHLTLCRFRAGERSDRVDAEIDCAPFEVARVLLMRSILTSAGAEHSALAGFDLVE